MLQRYTSTDWRRYTQRVRASGINKPVTQIECSERLAESAKLHAISQPIGSEQRYGPDKIRALHKGRESEKILEDLRVFTNTLHRPLSYPFSYTYCHTHTHTHTFNTMYLNLRSTVTMIQAHPRLLTHTSHLSPSFLFAMPPHEASGVSNPWLQSKTR